MPAAAVLELKPFGGDPGSGIAHIPRDTKISSVSLASFSRVTNVDFYFCV